MRPDTTLRIFLADDDRFSLSLYRQYLANLGYRNVAAFDNAIDCIDRLSDQPDVILLDYGMESDNSIETLRTIKKINPDIYVVFMSEQADAAAVLKLLKYGCFKCIVKGENDLENIRKVLHNIGEVRQSLKKIHFNFIKTMLDSL